MTCKTIESTDSLAALAADDANAADATILAADIDFIEKGGTIGNLLQTPLWREQDMPQDLQSHYEQFKADCRSLDAGFDHWLVWYKDRLAGRALDGP